MRGLLEVDLVYREEKDFDFDRDSAVFQKKTNLKVLINLNFEFFPQFLNSCSNLAQNFEDFYLFKKI